LSNHGDAATIVFAAGKGSRMTGYEGNKTLLPLKPGKTPYEGEVPILAHILSQLPAGPKAVVVHHRKDDVMRACAHLEVSFFDQPVLDGTGGALLAARPFLRGLRTDKVLITMGDVPFVEKSTYSALLDRLNDYPLVVLGFEPPDLKQYGLLETEDGVVRRIVEWKYWREYPPEERARLGGVCNSGIYAADARVLNEFVDAMETRPHVVVKERDGKPVEIKEYFITDLVELLAEKGLETGYTTAPDKSEVMGIDDPASLEKAQRIYRERTGSLPRRPQP